MSSVAVIRTGSQRAKDDGPGEGAGAVVKVSVCGDDLAIQRHGQRDEGDVVEGEAESLVA